MVMACYIIVPCKGQEIKRITYAQYMNMVDSGNIAYAAEKLNINIAKAQVIAAKVRNDPQIDFGYFNNDQPNKQMGYGGSVSLSQTLTFRKRTAVINLAKSESVLSQSLLADYLRNLHADATISFLEASKQDMLYKVKQNAYENVLGLAKSDSIRYVNGKIMEIDATQSKLEAGIMYNDILQSMTERDKAFSDLSLFTGSKNSSLLYHPSIALDLPHQQYVLADLIQKGIQSRADLVAAMQNIDVANKALKVARAEKNSDVTVSLGLSHNAQVKNDIAPAPAFTGITAGVSIPIPFSKLNKGNIEAAKHRAEQASLQYEQAVLEVQNEIMKAYYDYETTTKQVNYYKKGILKQAQDVLKAKTYSYQRGDTSLLEVLNAQRTYDDVQSLYYETLFNYTSAWVNLQKSIGTYDMRNFFAHATEK